jgi:hypothetical protein
MSSSALGNLDSGSEQWFRQRSIGSWASRHGWSEHHARADDLARKHESSAGQRRADSRHCSADAWSCPSQPWNRSQHQRVYAAIAERHSGARHNLTEIGNSWGYHAATGATGAQQSATKQWHEWEPDRTPFELVESRARSSLQGVPLFCPNNSELLHELPEATPPGSSVEQRQQCGYHIRLTLPSPDFDIASVLVPE